MRAVCSVLLVGLLSSVHAQDRPAVSPPAETYTHTIVRGDTLIGLSERLLIDPRRWPAVARLNRVRQPRRLRPGRPLVFPLAWLRSVPGQAEVLWVRGRPQVDLPDGSRRVALLGATLPPGSVVVTGPEERVRLLLSTGSTVTLGADARLTLVELRTLEGPQVKRTTLGVQRGRLESVVAPATHPAQKHEIRTPLVTSAVRGTDYRLEVGPTTVATEVTEGAVAVSPDAGTVLVERGYGAITRADGTTSPPRPLLPAPDLGAAPVRLDRLPLRLRWPAVAGAAGYVVEISPAAAPPPLVHLQVVSPEMTSADLPDGDYVLRARAVDADGLQGLEATRQFEVDARPVPPLVEAQSDGAVRYGDTLALRWTRPEGVEAFDLQVARDASFDAPLVERVALTDTALTLPLPPGQYVWRLASRHAGERGPWSDPVPVELRPTPPGGPPAGAQVQKTQLVLSWSAGVPGDRYAVQVSADPLFASTLVETEVAEPTLTLARPAPGRYHVRVRIVNTEGITGPYGPVQVLDVPKLPRRKWWWWLLIPLGAGALVAAR
jgi:hypothetical protein